MKLLSLFKFNRRKIDIVSVLKKLIEDTQIKFLKEFKEDSYNWKKKDSIKDYECLILAKFFLDYSFSILDSKIDKKAIL